MDKTLFTPNLRKHTKKYAKFRRDNLLCIMSSTNNHSIIKHDCFGYYELLMLKHWKPLGLYRKVLSGDVIPYERDRKDWSIYLEYVGLKKLVGIHKIAADFSGEKFDLDAVLSKFRYIMKKIR